MTLGLDTRLTLLAAGLIFLLALLLGAWKYRQMATCAGILEFFFVAAVGSYIVHGARRDTTNQFERPDAALRVAMIALIVGEVGAFAVLLAGFTAAQLL